MSKFDPPLALNQEVMVLIDGAPVSLGRVSKVLPKAGLVVVNAILYDATTGLSSEHLNTQRRFSIAPPAPEIRATLRKRELVDFLNSLRWDGFDLETLEQVNDMATGAPPIVSQIDQRDMTPARALDRFLDQAETMAESLKQAESRLNRRMDRLMTPRERADLLASKRFSMAAWTGCVETAAGNLNRLVKLTEEIRDFFLNREGENIDDSQ